MSARSSKIAVALGAAGALSVLLAWTPAAAQAKAAPGEKVTGLPPGETAENGSRTLGGHTFMHPVFLDSAFLSAYFGDGTRIGFEKATVGKTDLNVAAVFESIDFGIPIGKRVQLAFDGNYRALFGTDTTSLFVFGGSVGVSLRPGLRLLLVRSEPGGSELSFHSSAVVSLGPGVTPINLLALVASDAQGLIDHKRRLKCLLKLNLRCAFPGFGNVLAAVETNSEGFGGDFALNYAQTLGRYVGLQATADVQVQASSFTQYDVDTHRKKSDTSTPVTVEFGFGPALNLYPLAPVALQLEYLFELDASTANDGSATNALTHDFVAGIYYTGRRDLQLGVNATISVVDQATTTSHNITSDTTFNVFTGAFNIYYYF
jgi:hypothetical protein